MENTETPTPKYQVTYWYNETEKMALARISDTVVQGWQAKGLEFEKDFKHGHFQTTYPTKERLDEMLQKGFVASTLERYLQLQFDHHHHDDHFRDKANRLKNKMFQQRA